MRLIPEEEMKKYYHWLFPLLACLLAACGDDEYHYPSVKLEFLTASTAADGTLRSILTDDGNTYAIAEDLTHAKSVADTTLRIVGNYEQTAPSEVRLYTARSVVSPLPLPAEKFKEGVKTDPADVLGIWMGLDYLNMTLTVKAQNKKHAFHFVEDRVEEDAEAGHKEVWLTLYHDADGDTGYTQRAYLSVPLRHYAEAATRHITVHFSLHTSGGDLRQYDFEYIPLN